MRWLTAPCLLLGCLSIACQQQHPSAEQDRWKTTDEAVVNALQQSVIAGAQNAGITHVVLCWLKDPNDQSARQKIIDASKAFKDIPGVISVSGGRAVPSTRPVVDSSFDLAVIIRFTDEAAMAAYEEHPLHKKAVSDVLKPLTAKILIYDVRGEFAAGNITKR